MSRVAKRCAIYTRKSTEDGLDQEFNSLDAQREACEAFIASQRAEGWKALSNRYDDGGVSGGTLDRDAIQRLLDEVDQGRIDIVVVYKIDRLTRSLADFAKIVERFDAKGVSFVSVTQQFNTSTSMGRLTLNVLLSFAQFEREVTAERIRDKIAASKQKGLWMGGLVPLGYNAVDRKLVINEREAETVKSIFSAFAEGACVKAIASDLDAKGIRSKQRSNGCGGKAFSRGALYKILSNPIYRGEVAHRKKRYPGAHQGIISPELWEKAATRLEAGKRRETGKASHPSPLAGRIIADREPLTPTHATNHGRRYRYYVSRSLTEKGADDKAGWRLPASEVETIVVTLIRQWLSELAVTSSNSVADSIDDVRRRQKALEALSTESTAASVHSILSTWRCAIKEVAIHATSVRLTIDAQAPPVSHLSIEYDSMSVGGGNGGDIVIERAIRLARRGVGRKLILDDTRVEPDQTMIDLVVMARCWRAEIFENGAALKDLAARDGIDQGDASRFLPLAFLAPDLTLAILEGRQPVSLSTERLKRLGALPLAWSSQRILLGS